MNANLNKAIKILKNGGIIISPTDTTFIITCRADDKNAVERLFYLRKRDIKKPVPLLFSDEQMVGKYVKYVSKEVREKLINKYWPGGLTIVLYANKDLIHDYVRGGGDTVGVRIPDHSSVHRLIKEVGVPILGPSANFSGGKTPFFMSDLDPNLVRQVDFVLPGRCKIKKASTVLDVTRKPWKVIREGAVHLTN